MTTTRVLVILSLTTTPSRVFLTPTVFFLRYDVRGMRSARSLRMVWARARSRRAIATRAGFLATPIESWNLRLKSSSPSSRAFCCTSSSDISRHLVAFMDPSERPGAGHELGLDPDLLGGQAKALLGGGLVHPFHLVEDAPGLDHRDPELGVALALPHAGLGRLLGDRLVREDADEDLPAPLDAAGQRHSCRLDLAVGDPAGLERLEPELPEGERGAALGLALHAAALRLPILDPLGHQHGG